MDVAIGIRTATSPFEGVLTQPEGVDLLTLSMSDMNAIYEEAQTSVQRVLQSFMGKLGA